MDDCCCLPPRLANSHRLLSLIEKLDRSLALKGAEAKGGNRTIMDVIIKWTKHFYINGIRYIFGVPI